MINKLNTDFKTVLLEDIKKYVSRTNEIITTINTDSVINDNKVLTYNNGDLVLIKTYTDKSLLNIINSKQFIYDINKNLTKIITIENNITKTSSFEYNSNGDLINKTTI